MGLLSRFFEISQLCVYADTVTITGSQQPPPWGIKFVVTTNVTTNGQIRTKKPLRASDTEGYRGVRGTSGRTRTGTLLRAGDFESPVYTNFTTLARSTIIAATFVEASENIPLA